MKKLKTSNTYDSKISNTFARLHRWNFSNCGDIVARYSNRNNVTKVECKRCHVTVLRNLKGRHHDIIEVFENVSAYLE